MKMVAMLSIAIGTGSGSAYTGAAAAGLSQ